MTEYDGSRGPGQVDTSDFDHRPDDGPGIHRTRIDHSEKYDIGYDTLAAITADHITAGHGLLLVTDITITSLSSDLNPVLGQIRLEAEHFSGVHVGVVGILPWGTFVIKRISCYWKSRHLCIYLECFL